MMSRLLLRACLSLAVLLQIGPGTPAHADSLTFPQTIPGGHARAYFSAYNAGEAAMRAFWEAHGSPAALAQRPVEARVGVWRQMHGEHGALTPVGVQSSGDDFVEVLAEAELGQPIVIRFQCEPDARHGLGGLRVTDAPPGAAAPGSTSAPPGAPGTAGGPPAMAPPPEDSGPPPTQAEVVARMKADLDSLARIGEFSGAAVLAGADSNLFAQAYGLAAREANLPNRLDTKFNLGSLNKIFTHVAIEQLDQEGKLRITDTIDKYLPDYPKENSRRITIRMLLDHRAGVADVLEVPALEKRRINIRTMDDWYSLIRDEPLRFEPGTREEYSNGGFVLLGEIIAKVSGHDYYDYIQTNIYLPSRMSRSGHYALDDARPGRATGYTRNFDQPQKAGPDGRAPNLDILPGRGSSAGGGYSTVGDLVGFARALRQGRLLDEDHVRDIFGRSFSLAIAGGSPGVNALFVVQGPYTLVALANLDPPAAVRLAPTLGRMVRRLAGIPAPAPHP